MASNERPSSARTEDRPTTPVQQNAAADSPFIREILRLFVEDRGGVPATAAQIQEAQDIFGPLEPLTPRILAEIVAQFPGLNPANVINDAPPSYQTTVNGTDPLEHLMAAYNDVAATHSQVLRHHSADLVALHELAIRLIANSEHILTTQGQLVANLERLSGNVEGLITTNRGIIGTQRRLLAFQKSQQKRFPRESWFVRARPWIVGGLLAPWVVVYGSWIILTLHVMMSSFIILGILLPTFKVMRG
ncbi:MAG: hypothetical protein M1835_001406 [Candelina submexicana]|nr:MAG: hypothetical protein M1835_001406 [Candelina submexicana]